MARSWQGYQGTCHGSWQECHGFEHWEITVYELEIFENCFQLSMVLVVSRKNGESFKILLMFPACYCSIELNFFSFFKSHFLSCPKTIDFMRLE